MVLTMKKVGAIALAGGLVIGAVAGAFTGPSQADIKQEIDDAVAEAKIETMDKACGDMDIVDGVCVPKPVEEQPCGVLSEGEAQVFTPLLDFWSEEYVLDDTIHTETLDEGNHIQLIDGQYELDGDKIDYHEELVINAEFITSMDNRELGKDIAVESDKLWQWNSLIDDSVLSSDISEENPLDIKVLGRDVRVVGVGDNEITILYKGKTELEEGRCYTLADGKVLRLKKVGFGTIAVEVDGEFETIGEGHTQTVNGVEVSVDSVFPEDGVPGTAYVRVGSDIKETVSNGDGFALLGKELDEDGDELSDSKYTVAWDIQSVSKLTDPLGTLDRVSVYENLDRTSFDDDETLHPLKIGEKRVLPNGYLTIVFDGYTEEQEYVDYSLKVTDNAVKVKSDNEEAFVVGTDEYDLVYVKQDSVTLLYGIYNDEDVLLGTSVDLEETEHTLDVDSATGVITIGGDIVYTINYADNEITSAEFAGKDLTIRDEDLMDNAGKIVESPEDNCESGKASILLAREQPEVELTVKTEKVVEPEVEEEVKEVVEEE